MYNRYNYRRKYSSKYSRRYSNRVARPITYGQIGSKLMRDVAYLKSIINVERKYIDTTISAQAASIVGTLALVNGVALGDTGQTRDGQSIKIVSIELKGYIQINSAATTTDSKIAFVLDSQANAAAPLVSNVWSSGSPIALRLIGTGSRFQVLHSRNMALSADGTEIVHFKWYKKVNFHTKYNTGNVGDITDIVTNSLFFFYSSSESVNFPTINASIRIRFIDN